MGAVVKLEFEGHRLYALELPGDKLPWFVVIQACEILELKDHHQAVERVPARYLSRYTIPSQGQRRSFQIISFSGLCRLARNSRKPVGRRLEDWLDDVVLPRIWLTGKFEGDSSPLNDLIAELQPALALPEPEQPTPPPAKPAKPPKQRKEENVVYLDPVQPALFEDPEQTDVKVDSYRGSPCTVTLHDPHDRPIEVTIAAPEAPPEEISHMVECGNSFFADGIDIEDHCGRMPHPDTRGANMHPLVYAECWIMYHLSRRGIPFSK